VQVEVEVEVLERHVMYFETMPCIFFPMANVECVSEKGYGRKMI
jgi:hypothetical protein